MTDKTIEEKLNYIMERFEDVKPNDVDRERWKNRFKLVDHIDSVFNGLHNGGYFGRQPKDNGIFYTSVKG